MTLNLAWDDSTNRDYLKGTLKETFLSTDHNALVQHKDIFREIGSGDQYDRFSRWAGLPHGGSLGDGAVIPTYDPVKGTEIEYAQIRYGSGFTITSSMKLFQKFNAYNELMKDLKKTSLEMKDIEVWKLLNNPTDTTYGSGYDGKALLHDSHDLLDDASTTYDNYVTADLSITSLEDGKVYFQTIKDDQGFINPSFADKLVVPPQLETTAHQLTQSDKVPFEFSNTKSMVPSWKFSVYLAYRMTDSDAWYLMDTKAKQFGLFTITSQEPDVKVQDAADTSRSIWCTAQQHFQYGVLDQRYVYGSVPA